MVLRSMVVVVRSMGVVGSAMSKTPKRSYHSIQHQNLAVECCTVVENNIINSNDCKKSNSVR